MIMIGYSEQSKAYRFYDATSRKVHVCRDAVFHADFKNSSVNFNESLVNFGGATTFNKNQPTEDEPSSEVDAEEALENVEINTGDQDREETKSAADENPRLLRSGKVYNTINSLSCVVPSIVPEAMNSSNAEEWKVAMQIYVGVDRLATITKACRL